VVAAVRQASMIVRYEDLCDQAEATLTATFAHVGLDLAHGEAAAMASRLISDGSGPLYRHGNGDLAHAVRAARLALDPVAPADWDVATAA